MDKRRNRIYLFLGIACLAGYLWLGVAFKTAPEKGVMGACLIKGVTGIPCPSCGATRSVLSLLHGDIWHAIL